MYEKEEHTIHHEKPPIHAYFPPAHSWYVTDSRDRLGLLIIARVGSVDGTVYHIYMLALTPGWMGGR